jgi:hypothetical protein
MLALGAEAAADIRRDHPQRILGHAQLFAHQQSHMVWRLGAGPEREGGAIGGQAAAAFVGRLCQHCTRFDGSAAQALVAQADACDMRGPGKGRIGGSRIAALSLHAQVIRQPGMHPWRIRARCIARIHHRRQRLPFDLHRFGGICRLLRRVGQHHCQRFTDVAHRAARQGVARRLGHGRAIGASQTAMSCPVSTARTPGN